MIGTVISNKMNKTVIVKVETFKIHPKYLKRYRVSKKYAAHNELPDIKTGDTVEIESSRPYSKTVRWKVTKKI